MAPTLYMVPLSPPVRAVLLCAKAIGLELNLKEVKLFEGEHVTPEYLKINPQHTVPTLNDDGFFLADSHAIMAYLVSKYGMNDSLYPKDLQKRAIVDQRLHFENGVLFGSGRLISRGFMREGERSINPKYLALVEDAFNVTERILEKSTYIAGDQLTIADFSCISTITTWDWFVTVTEEKYPNIAAWIKRMQQLPYYKEANQDGLDEYFTYLKKFWHK